MARKKAKKIDKRFYYPLLLSAVGLILLPIIFGIAGIVLGVITLEKAKKKEERNWCYAGIVMGIAVILLPFLILFLTSPAIY